MRSSRPSSPRRALHERTPSHNNETSPPNSLRHTRSKSTYHSDREQDRENVEEEITDEYGIYSSTPYPTKPEHILLPSPGKGQHHPQPQPPQQQQSPSLTSGTFSSSFLSSAEPSQLAESDSWFNLLTSSQSWLNDPDSSRSSVPLQTQGHESNDDTTVLHEEEENEEEKKTVGSDDMNLPPTVRTVKPVASEPPSRHQSEYHGSSEPSSSPNVVPLGPPSSPNFVAHDNSSANLVLLGTPSQHPESPLSPISPLSPSRIRSHSISSSVNSFGTVIRHAGAAPWIHGSSSDQSSWAGGRSFHSTPPYQSVAGSARSNSSSHPSRSLHSHSRSHTSSSRSRPVSEVPSNNDASLSLHYPVVQPPSSSGSWAEASSPENTPAPADQHQSLNLQQELIPERSESRITSHLSTVPSQWSAECDNSFATERSVSAEPPPARPETALGLRSRDPSSSLWLINDQSNEHLDNVTNLPARPVHSRRASSPSAHSRRTSSLRSIVSRPGTSSSAIPTWAKMYYRDGHPVNSSTASLSDPSRPATGSSHIKRPSTTRPNKTRHGQRGIDDSAAAATAATPTAAPAPVAEDARDPRRHWVTPEPQERLQPGWYPLRHSWSPHLYGDRGDQSRPSMWLAPSMDSRTEPFLGRRNLQVWSFCLGFIFPLAWLVAALLPLPRKPNLDLEANMPSSDIALHARVYDLEQRRYDNARWWRNLNRWMIPVGFIIIAVVVCFCPLPPRIIRMLTNQIILAVVGTTVGF